MKQVRQQAIVNVLRAVVDEASEQIVISTDNSVFVRPVNVAWLLSNRKHCVCPFSTCRL